LRGVPVARRVAAAGRGAGLRAALRAELLVDVRRRAPLPLAALRPGHGGRSPRIFM